MYIYIFSYFQFKIKILCIYSNTTGRSLNIDHNAGYYAMFNFRSIVEFFVSTFFHEGELRSRNDLAFISNN